MVICCNSNKKLMQKGFDNKLYFKKQTQGSSDFLLLLTSLLVSYIFKRMFQFHQSWHTFWPKIAHNILLLFLMPVGSVVIALLLMLCVCEFALRGHRFDPQIGKIPQKREWQSTPIFLLGKSHRRRSLAGYLVYGVPIIFKNNFKVIFKIKNENFQFLLKNQLIGEVFKSQKWILILSNAFFSETTFF